MPDETPAPEAGKGQEPTKPAGQTPEPSPQGDSPKTFDEAYVKELRSENAAARKARQELEAKLNEYEERDKSELEKLTGKVTKAEQRAADAEAKLLRYSVAQEKEVPAKLVPLLTASSREDLESQADLILENAKPEQPPEFDGGPREPAPDPKTPDQAHNELAVALFGTPQQP